jgi:hypothetical protein
LGIALGREMKYEIRTGFVDEVGQGYIIAKVSVKEVHSIAAIRPIEKMGHVV